MIAGGCASLQVLRDLDAVHLGHADVEQDDVHLLAVDDVERLAPGARLADDLERDSSRHSASRSRSRARAGASSSTIRIRGTSALGEAHAARLHVGHADVHPVLSVARPPTACSPPRRSEAAGARGCWRAPSCCPPGWPLVAPETGWSASSCTLVAASAGCRCSISPASVRGLDAVVDGVLEQRLEQERRDQRVGGHLVDVASATSQPVAEPQLLDLQVLAASSISRAIGESSRLSAITTRKRSARSSSALLGAPRLLADQREHRVDAVVEEVRAGCAPAAPGGAPRRSRARARARAGRSRRAAEWSRTARGAPRG